MKTALTALLSLGLAAFAVAEPIPAGTLELGINGGLNNMVTTNGQMVGNGNINNSMLDFSSPDGDVEFYVDVSLGYFAMDNIAFGGLASVGYNGSDGGYGIGPFGEVTFDLDSFVAPYVAGRIKYHFGDFYPDNFLLVEGGAGLKFFLSESVAISSEVFYDLTSEDVFVNDGNSENTNTGLKLGVRAYF